MRRTGLDNSFVKSPGEHVEHDCMALTSNWLRGDSVKSFEFLGPGSDSSYHYNAIHCSYMPVAYTCLVQHTLRPSRPRSSLHFIVDCLPKVESRVRDFWLSR